MSEDARGGVPEEMDGLSTEDAVERIVERDDSLDPATVRERLEYVTQDGVVCQEGVKEGLGDVSGIIATPENRIDIARREFETAVEAAEPVADLAIVGSRLETLDDRLVSLKEQVDQLGPELNELFNEWLKEPDDVYQMADGLHQHAARGQRMHGLVDELIHDVESFQQWVESEATRFEELDRDVDGVEESLDDLEETLSGLGDAEGDGTPAEEDPDPVFVWVDAALRHRLLELLVTDLEVELAGVRAWTERIDGDTAEVRRLDGRIDAVRERWKTLDGRVETAARPAWRERFGERIVAFEEDLEAVDPPVDWGEVQRTLQKHQAEIGPEN